MNGQDALAALRVAGGAEKAAKDAAYHKTDRETLGVPGDVLSDLTADWRTGLDPAARVALADGLWRTGVFDARLAAAKVLVQARMRPDDAAWDLLCDWVPEFDGWAIADTACGAIGRRLVARPERLDVVERWARSDLLWLRRTVLVATLPWTKQRHPSDAERAVRERVLGWCAEMVGDERWFIQKAIAWWLRDLSRRDGARVAAWLDAHGAELSGFARAEAARLLERG